jgi:hypothetical protein
MKNNGLNQSHSSLNSIDKNDNDTSIKDKTPIRLLIVTESFHPYTSGIARRFQELIKRLCLTNEFRIHIITGVKVI